MDIAEVIDKFGLPVGLLIYFIWRDFQTSREHKADLKNVANTAVQAIDKGTDAINDSVDAINKSTVAVDKSTAQLSETSNIVNRAIGVLSSLNRGQGNGGGN